MTTNLLPLFYRLAAAAPEMCDPITGRRAWAIGEYEFYFDLGDELMAQYAHIVVSGQPALDWLAGALMAAIREKGFERIHMHYNGRADLYSAMALKSAEDYSSYPGHVPTLAEALLTALVAAVEAERVQ